MVLLHFAGLIPIRLMGTKLILRVNGGNMNTLSNLTIIAAIHNRIAWQWVLDVRFINGLSLTTGIVVKMC